MSRLEKLFQSRIFVTLLIALPGVWPAWPILSQDPTVAADPSKYLLHHYGFVACILLAAVLALTPLRVLFPGWGLAQALNRHRRRIGVSAFFYALIHLGFQIIHEGGWPTFLTDARKPFILAGLAVFSILAVLAVTSINRVVRWMGGHRWKNLHRLAYLAAALAAYHQAAARKLFPVQVLWIFVPLLVLELARVIRRTGHRVKFQAAE